MKNRSLRLLPVLALCGLALPFVAPEKADAIPAFTRQHKTECATCHTVFPELTEQGENFYKNSFVWDTAAVKLSPAAKAAKEKEMKEKEYLILSSLPEGLPISFMGTLNMSYNDAAVSSRKLDLSTRALALQAGGALADKLGYYVSYNLYTEGPFDPAFTNAPGNNTPNLNELFLSARHVFNTPVNIKAGRMRPDLSLWKGFNKTSISPMATTGYKVGSSQFFADAPVDALEANGIVAGRLYMAAGAAKRKNQDTLEGFGSVSYKIGGADFEGREQAVNLDSDSIFDYLIMTVGAYGYGGKNKGNSSTATNSFHRFGLETDIRYQRYHAKLASAFGNDKNPDFSTTSPISRDSLVVAADVEYLFGSNVIPSFRFEYEDGGNGITRRYIPAVAYAPLQNAKLVFEYRHDDAPAITNRIFNVGAVISF